VLLLWHPCGATAQNRLASITGLRCSFTLKSTGTWSGAGEPEGTATPAALTQVFDAIDVDEGTGQLRSGQMTSEVIVRQTGIYLHFVQSFRTGPLYTTTVFDNETAPGRFKAVHSRHEFFPMTLAGITSSPEQYLGTCEVVKQPATK
jgi:hypothetical protein